MHPPQPRKCHTNVDISIIKNFNQPLFHQIQQREIEYVTLIQDLYQENQTLKAILNHTQHLKNGHFDENKKIHQLKVNKENGNIPNTHQKLTRVISHEQLTPTRVNRNSSQYTANQQTKASMEGGILYKRTEIIRSPNGKCNSPFRQLSPNFTRIPQQLPPENNPIRLKMAPKNQQLGHPIVNKQQEFIQPTRNNQETGNSNPFFVLKAQLQKNPIIQQQFIKKTLNCMRETQKIQQSENQHKVNNILINQSNHNSKHQIRKQEHEQQNVGSSGSVPLSNHQFAVFSNILPVTSHQVSQSQNVVGHTHSVPLLNCSVRLPTLSRPQQVDQFSKKQQVQKNGTEQIRSNINPSLYQIEPLQSLQYESQRQTYGLNQICPQRASQQTVDFRKVMIDNRVYLRDNISKAEQGVQFPSQKKTQEMNNIEVSYKSNELVLQMQHYDNGDSQQIIDPESQIKLDIEQNQNPVTSQNHIRMVSTCAYRMEYGQHAHNRNKSSKRQLSPQERQLGSSICHQKEQTFMVCSKQFTNQNPYDGRNILRNRAYL